MQLSKLKVLKPPEPCDHCTNGTWPNCPCWDHDGVIANSAITFVDKAGGLSQAIEFEEKCLSIGREFIPNNVIKVIDNAIEPDEAYWNWLISQL